MCVERQAAGLRHEKPQVEKRRVMEDYRQWMRDHHQRFVQTDAYIGKYLSEVFGQSISRKVRLVSGGARIPVYTFPPLAEAQERFFRPTSSGRKLVIRRQQLDQ